MKLTQMFPSKYVKAGDIGDHKPVVTIESFRMDDVGIEGEKENKPIISFVGKDKEMVLNKTNANTIAGLYGDDTKDWIGKKIRLYVAAVPFRGKMGPAIRIDSIKPDDATKSEEGSDDAF